MTRAKVWKLISGLVRVGGVRLPDFGPRDPSKRWLAAIGYMVQCCIQ